MTSEYPFQQVFTTDAAAVLPTPAQMENKWCSPCAERQQLAFAQALVNLLGKDPALTKTFDFIARLNAMACMKDATEG